MLSRVFGIFCCSLVISMVCRADVSTEDWRAFSYGAAKYYVAPAYTHLKAQSSNLVSSVEKLCQSEDDKQLAISQKAFYEVMQAWQAIQHIRFGPIEIMMRGFDMQYWPDKKNYIGKEMGVLLSDKDSAVIESDKFYQLSVSIKGLPLIERLLFETEYSKSLIPGSYECRFLQRVSLHVLEMAEGLDQEWRKEMIDAFAVFGEDEYFFDETEAATSLLKALIEPIEVIEELKLKRPLGNKKAKYRKLESWRSQGSLENINNNIKALRLMYSGDYLKHVPEQEKGSVKSLSSMFSDNERQLIDQAFMNVEKAIAKIASPLESAITTSHGRENTLALVKALSGLNRALVDAVTEKGIHLGFNSRDGD